MVDFVKILTTHYPECSWSLNGDGYVDLHWPEENQAPKPSESHLLALWSTTQEQFAAECIRVSKQRCYQEEADPLFFKWQRGEATQQEWLDKIEEIKNRPQHDLANYSEEA